MAKFLLSAKVMKHLSLALAHFTILSNCSMNSVACPQVTSKNIECHLLTMWPLWLHVQLLWWQQWRKMWSLGIYCTDCHWDKYNLLVHSIEQRLQYLLRRTTQSISSIFTFFFGIWRKKCLLRQNKVSNAPLSVTYCTLNSAQCQYSHEYDFF